MSVSYTSSPCTQRSLPLKDIYFPTNTVKQDKPPSLSVFPAIQVEPSVTHTDSNGTRVPEIMTNFMIFSISGDPMYLIEGKPNQNHQANIDSLRKTSDSDIFSSTGPFNLSIPTQPQKTLQQLLALVLTSILLKALIFTPPPMYTNAPTTVSTSRHWLPNHSVQHRC